MELINFLFEPFIEFGFMRRALIGCIALTISAAPLGVFLLYRRLSLVGDALSHGVLPGVAIAYIFYGSSLIAMGIGGFIAGIIVAFFAGLISRYTELKEEASFAGMYLASLALGVVIASSQGSSTELLHFLFGSILAIDDQSLIIIGIISSVSIIILTAIYRIIIIDSFDQQYLKIKNYPFSGLVHLLFLALVVLNLIAGFQILGTLMTVGILILPALSARFWCKNIGYLIIWAIIFAILSSFIGLSWSYYKDITSGPAIILASALLFIISLLFGINGSILQKYFHRTKNMLKS